jgi:beta-lactamase regulating signal transducer with metallopeptidase domain
MNALFFNLNPLAALWLAALWRACWQGGLALLLVWAVCRAFHRLPARAKSWLWRLAYLKLLVAFLWAAPIALPLLPRETPRPEGEAQRPLSSAPVEIPSPAVSIAEPAAPAPPIASASAVALPSRLDSAPSVHIRPNAASWLLLIWCLGVGWFGIGAWRDLRRARLLLRGCAPVADPALLQCCAELAGALGLRAVPSLLMTDAISSPLLLAGSRPVIVLPSALAAGSNLEHLRLMIAHEMAHLKRFDLWWVWLAVAGEGLFFFHPLLWLARREWRLTQEMACDEMAVRLTRVPASTYGEMLVGVAALKLSNRHEPILVTLGLTETKEMLARRLNAMKLIKSKSTKTMALTTAAILVVSAAAVLPWRLVAQPAPPADATTPSTNAGQSPGAGIPEPPAAGGGGYRGVLGASAWVGGGGSFGGGGGYASTTVITNDSGSNTSVSAFASGGSGGIRRGGMGGFTPPPTPATPPTNVEAARFEATVYELEVPENRIADLDAVKLESSAATPQALATALGAFGTPKILYKVDQIVNLYGENISLGTQVPLITGALDDGSGKPRNLISYTSVGLVTRISAAPSNAIKPPVPQVQLNFILSVLADSDVPISDTVNGKNIRSVQLSQSGTPTFGKPTVLVTVNATDANAKTRPVAYIVRYRFSQPTP